MSAGLYLSVSIHAPGRGATSRCSRGVAVRGFQFTHPGGVRQGLRGLSAYEIAVFQFTHPGGVRRHSRLGSRASSCGFNSRTREGCDE